MKKNLRSVIALLLIVFNISIIFDNSLINNLNNSNVSVCSDEDNTRYDTEHDTITLRRSVRVLFRAAAFAFYLL